MSAHNNKRVPVVRDATHPIHADISVTVLGFDSCGRPVREGRGVIVRPAAGPHRYFVLFDGALAGTAVERFVHPEYQLDPEAYLSWMLEMWVACMEPATNDFFP